MSKTEQLRDEVILEKLRKLSSDKKREILDFLEFLETGEKAKGWLEFDEWAVNLAKENSMSVGSGGYGLENCGGNKRDSQIA
jgi:hypothetical protein